MNRKSVPCLRTRERSGSPETAGSGNSSKRARERSSTCNCAKKVDRDRIAASAKATRAREQRSCLTVNVYFRRGPYSSIVGRALTACLSDTDERSLKSAVI
jgi:hypothetical protein